MAETPKLENRDRVLIVEGYSDLLFYAELLEALGKDGEVFIKQFNGRSDLATKLETFLTPQLLATKQAIGVIVDADTNPQATAAQLTKLLSELTGQSVAGGKWTKNKPRIGLFLTPDGSSNGEIETLVWQAWSGDPANEQPRRCVDEFVTCMSKAGFTARSRDKGVVSALLAIRNDDDPRLGPGARAKVFDFGRPEFSQLKRFLSEL
jgi:Protein of unknown function (DUF3226)